MNSSEYTVLLDALEHNAGVRPQSRAIACGIEVITYQQLRDTSERVTAALWAMGVKPGHRVGILSRNNIRFFECLFGINRIGGVFCPINWRLAPAEIAYIVDDAGIEVLFIEHEFANQIQSTELASSLQLISLDRPFSAAIDFDTWLATGATPAPSVERESSDTAILMYTSGSTGRPKGVKLSNRNWSKCCDIDRDAWPQWWRSSPASVALLPLPTFHVGGMEVAMRSIFSGGLLVLMREFDPAGIIDHIERWGVTFTCAVPAALRLLLSHPKAANADFSSLETFAYGGEPIPLDLLKQAQEVLGCGFVQAYGMTEACSTVTTLAPSDHTLEGSEKMRSLGKPLPGVQIKIVDSEGNTVPTRGVGEILIKSRDVMEGYWNQAEAVGSPFDREGYLRSGDAGFLDEDGYLYLHSRLKDMIISGGENVSAVEVERVLCAHPQVSEAAVIGVPDTRWGESVKAVVVRRAGGTVSADELIDWTRANLARFKTPRTVEFIPELPRTSGGKVKKAELRARYA